MAECTQAEVSACHEEALCISGSPSVCVCKEGYTGDGVDECAEGHVNNTVSCLASGIKLKVRRLPLHADRHAHSSRRSNRSTASST